MKEQSKSTRLRFVKAIAKATPAIPISKYLTKRKFKGTCKKTEMVEQ